VTRRLAAIRVGGADPTRWQAAGFALDDAGRVAFTNGAIEFGGEEGVVELVLEADDRSREMPSNLEGIPLVVGPMSLPADHPNGAYELDHLVVMTDSLERTSDAVTATLGLDRRRIRETDSVRQAFHRFPGQGGSRGCILEVVESSHVGATGVFGVVANVVDLDATVALLGDLVGAAKDAVQPGRRVATIRSAAELGFALALMTP
jgi:hypothetical protein